MRSGIFSSWLGIAHPLYRTMDFLWHGTKIRVVLLGSDKTVAVSGDFLYSSWGGTRLVLRLVEWVHPWREIQQGILQCQQPSDLTLF